MTSPAIDSAVLELAEGPFCLFCGAGISLYSDVPLAGTLVTAVLDLVGMNDGTKSEFLSVQLPFESVMEVLLQATGLQDLFKVFQGTKPNQDHVLFARLAARGFLSTVVTTNFDTFLEDSLNEQGVPFDLYYRDQELRRISWNSGRVQLLKLHGTLRDPRSLAITIRGVANQTLVANRAEALLELLGHPGIRVILIIGYSCSDRFDIGPAIRRVPSTSQRILFVQHVDVPPADATLDDIAVWEENPFSRFVGNVLRCNADDLLNAACGRLLGAPISEPVRPAGIWRDYLTRWHNNALFKYGKNLNSYLAGHLLQRAGRYKRSTELLEQFVAVNTQMGLQISAFQTIGDNYRDLGRCHEALENLRIALELSRACRLPLGQARALGSIGIVLEDLGDHSRAISCYKRAMRLSRRARNKEIEGKCNGNAGIAYKSIGDRNSLMKSVLYHENALRIARIIGDKASEGRTLGNLGVTHKYLDDTQKALDYYKQALSIAEDLGDVRHIGIWTANAGMDIVDVSPLAARNYLERAIRIFSNLDLHHYVKECEDSLKKIKVNPDASSSPGPTMDGEAQ